MIAKILKHSKSFAGLEYNRLKTLNGKAELLEVKNFELDAMAGLTGRPNVSTYLDFLNYIADRRPDIGYRQFHAVISCQGREMSKEQLLDAARQYVEKMGYGDQPYLVFFHKDTDNNHVHIVSTRVRYDGSLVPDKSERFRSLAAIREINRQYDVSEEPDLRARAQKDIDKAMEWTFAYDNNLVSILKKMGYKLEKSVTEPEQWLMSCDGEMCGTILQSRIDERKKAYKAGISVRVNSKLTADLQPDMYKRKQLLFKKLTEYAGKGYSFEEIKSLHELRTQLGFHIESTVKKDKDGKDHISWSVTDYPGKTIFKGSDVFPVETLVRSEEYRSSADHFYDLVNQVLIEEGSKCGWKQFAARMSELGYIMHTAKGNVAYATLSGSKGQFHLPQDAVVALNYNQRVINVSAMDIHSEEELMCLAAIHRIKAADVRPAHFVPEDKNMRKSIRATLSSIMHNLAGENLSAALKKEKVSVILMNNKLFFYHPQGGLYTADQLGIGFTTDNVNDLGLNLLDVNLLNKYYDRWNDYLNEQTVSYPEIQDTSANDQEQFRATDESRQTAIGDSNRRRRSEDYGYARERSASPAMDAILKPITLAGFLEQMAHIAYHMKAGSRGGEGGRSRKRRRKDDDDNDD